MKYKHILSIAVLGVVAHLFAFWCKITHQAIADLAILISIGIILLSGLLLVIKMLITKNKDSFLNK